MRRGRFTRVLRAVDRRRRGDRAARADPTSRTAAGRTPPAPRPRPASTNARSSSSIAASRRSPGTGCRASRSTCWPRDRSCSQAARPARRRARAAEAEQALAEQLGAAGAAGDGEPRPRPDRARGRRVRRSPRPCSPSRSSTERRSAGPLTRLALAEALARSGQPERAAEQIRATVLEPVRPSDFPEALVPRLARVQGLIALAARQTATRRRGGSRSRSPAGSGCSSARSAPTASRPCSPTSAGRSSASSNPSASSSEPARTATISQGGINAVVS